jgi:cob(I)alamin adenosyltransferase
MLLWMRRASDRVAFDEKHALQLESWIDVMDDQVPPLKNFILPVRIDDCTDTMNRCTTTNQSLDSFTSHANSTQGGGMASATLHVCRTVCRRAERKVVALAQDEHVHPSVSIYLNRCVAGAQFGGCILYLLFFSAGFSSLTIVRVVPRLAQAERFLLCCRALCRHEGRETRSHI